MGNTAHSSFNRISKSDSIELLLSLGSSHYSVNTKALVSDFKLE